MHGIYNFAAASSSTDWPAWVQAVGSVAAIIAAVSIARADQRRASEIRAFRKKSYAFLLLPEVESIQQGVLDANAAWRGGADVETVMAHLNAPAGITERLMDLHELEAAGPAIQAALSALADLRYDVQDNYDCQGRGPLIEMEDGTWEELPRPNDLETSFERARSLSGKACKQVRDIMRG